MTNYLEIAIAKKVESLISDNLTVSTAVQALLTEDAETEFHPAEDREAIYDRIAETIAEETASETEAFEIMSNLWVSMLGRIAERLRAEVNDADNSTVN